MTTFRVLRIHQGRMKCEVASSNISLQLQVRQPKAMCWEGSKVAEGRQVENTGGPLVDTNGSESGTNKNTNKLQNTNNKEPGQCQSGKNLGGRTSLMHTGWSPTNSSSMSRTSFPSLSAIAPCMVAKYFEDLQMCCIHEDFKLSVTYLKLQTKCNG